VGLQFGQELGNLSSHLDWPIEAWHSHPSIPGYNPEFFSPEDIQNANAYNLKTDLLTPSGWVLTYQGDQARNVKTITHQQAAAAGTPVGWFSP